MKGTWTRALLLGLALWLLCGAVALAGPVYYSGSITPIVEPEVNPGTFNILYKSGLGTGGEFTDGGFTADSWVEIKSAEALGFAAPVVSGKTYVFAGWSIQQQATLADALRPDARFGPGRTVQLKDDLTLWAVWLLSGGEDQARIVYHRNAGDTAKATRKYLSGEAIALPTLAEFGWSAPEGYAFAGWAGNASATVPTFYAGERVAVDGEDNALYAVWSEKGEHLDFSMYVSNNQWDKNGVLRNFKTGERAKLRMIVTNTGTQTIDKVVVYLTLKGAVIDEAEGYSVVDGEAVIRNLAPHETVMVKGHYKIRSADHSKKKLVASAAAFYGKREAYAEVKIPVKRTSGSSGGGTVALPAATPAPAMASPLFVYAPSSMELALGRVRAAYELAYPDRRVTIQFGDSLEQSGAIARLGTGDLFLSQGEEAMDALDIMADPLANPMRADRLLPYSRRVMAEDRAVLAGRTGLAPALSALPGLLSGGQAKLAISTGEDAAGDFARLILPELGLDPAALQQEGRLIACQSAKEVAASLVAGQATLGILTGTEAVNAGLVAAMPAEETLYAPVPYLAAILRDSRQQAAAQAFLSYLAGPEARIIFQNLGYDMP